MHQNGCQARTPAGGGGGGVRVRGCDCIPIATPSWKNYIKIELTFHLKMCLTPNFGLKTVIFSRFASPVLNT